MWKNAIKSSWIIVTVLANFYSGASAHEFWVEPIIYSAKIDVKVAAHPRVGQLFKGEGQYYIPSDIKNATVTDSDGTKKLIRKIGDFPIFDQIVAKPGLQILAYATTPGELIYDKPGKFATFLKKHNLQYVLKRNAERGFKETGFTEHFVRYTKALLNRGPVSGADQKLGLMLELVAQKNPYDAEFSDGGELPVKLFWKGKPFANSQIDIFEKSGKEVVISHTVTDAQGLALIPVKPNKAYMINTIQMTEEDKKASGADWKSHWASLTFSLQ